MARAKNGRDVVDLASRIGCLSTYKVVATNPVMTFGFKWLAILVGTIYGIDPELSLLLISFRKRKEALLFRFGLRIWAITPQHRAFIHHVNSRSDFEFVLTFVVLIF